MAESRFIDGPAGRIDTRWHGDGSGKPILLLHPHPFHGGSMGTRLVYQLACALAEDGHPVVRFDFRGVGRSEGRYDRGLGEAEDGQAVLDAVRADMGEPILIGFSFGGAIATKLAARNNSPHLICIATPAKVRDSELDVLTDAAAVHAPVHLVYGSKDELVSQADAEALANAFPTTPRWHILDGADHFLTPTHIPRAVSAVRKALAEQHL